LLFLDFVLRLSILYDEGENCKVRVEKMAKERSGSRHQKEIDLLLIKVKSSPSSSRILPN
jgi:hypothetical protein